MRRAPWFAFALVLAASPAALAQESGADEASIRGFSPTELTLLDGALDRGPVILAQFREASHPLPSIVVALKVNAPPATVAEVIAAPEAYPRFMPALDSIRVESRQGIQTAYSWRWQVSVFELEGRNSMTVYPGNATRGHRIDVRSLGGDMGEGRMRWRVRPDGPGRSIVVLASRVDMRDANYLAEQLASGGTSVQRSITLSLATVMALGTQREAERRAGHVPAPPPAELPALARPDIDPLALTPLLARGDLVFMELVGDRVARVAFAGRAGVGEDDARAVMNDPEEFGQTLVNGSTAEILETGDDGSMRFSWGIPIPLVGLAGQMRLHPSAEDVVHVEGVSGALRSGAFHFDTVTFPWGEAALVGWARFDIRETSRLVRRIVDADRDFAKGLSAATQVMVVRSLRRRAMAVRDRRRQG
ncbi:MAG: SRPBCC family protein [Myxococcota bacterium]